jgi:hypothetical protein
MSYNIVNHDVISEERLNTSLTMPQRSINRCKKSIKVNVRQRESGQREFDQREVLIYFIYLMLFIIIH